MDACRRCATKGGSRPEVQSKGGRRAYEERVLFWRWWRHVANGGPPHSACLRAPSTSRLSRASLLPVSPIATAAAAAAIATGTADTSWWRRWPCYAHSCDAASSSVGLSGSGGLAMRGAAAAACGGGGGARAAPRAASRFYQYPTGPAPRRTRQKLVNHTSPDQGKPA